MCVIFSRLILPVVSSPENALHFSTLHSASKSTKREPTHMKSLKKKPKPNPQNPQNYFHTLGVVGLRLKGLLQLQNQSMV